MDNNNTPMNEDNVNEKINISPKEESMECKIHQDTEGTLPAQGAADDGDVSNIPEERMFDDGSDEKHQTYYNFADSIPQSAITPPVTTESPEASSMATKAMVLAIIAVGLNVTCGCFPASIVLAIIALVTSSKAKKLLINKADGRITAATICSIIALVMSAIVLLSIAFVFFMAILGSILETGGTAMFIL